VVDRQGLEPGPKDYVENIRPENSDEKFVLTGFTNARCDLYSSGFPMWVKQLD
jgi:hypothetical protein